MSGLTVRLYTAEEIHDQHGTTVAETVKDYLANALEWCGLSDGEYTIDIPEEPYPESRSDGLYDFLDWLKSRDAYRNADCSHLLADGGLNHSIGRVSRANAADINPDFLPETPQKYLKAGPSTHDQLWIALHELGHAIGLEGGDVPPDSTNLAHNPGLHYRHDAAYDDPSERERGIYWTPVGANENSVNMCGNVGTDPTESDLPKMWDMRYYRDCLGELIRVRYGSADTRIEDLIKYTDALIVGTAGPALDYEIVVSGEAAPVDGKMWQRETTPNGEDTVPVVAKTTGNAEVEGGRISGTVSEDEHHGFYFSGELQSIDVDRPDDLRLWLNRYPHTLVIDGVEGKEAEYEVTVSGTLERGGFGEALPSEDGVVDVSGGGNQKLGSSTTGTVTGDADGYLFTGDVKSVVVDPPEAARVSVDGEERPPDYPRTLVVDGREGGTGAEYEIQVSGGIQGYEGELPAGDGTVGVGINPSEQITERSAEGVVIGGADGYRFSGEIESLVVAPTSEATVYVDGKERRSDYPHTLVIDGTIGGKTAEYEVEVTGGIRGFEGRLPAGDGLIGTNINDAEDIGGRSATGTVADYADGYVFSGQLTDITVTPPEEARVYVDGEEQPVEDGNKPPTAAFDLSQTPPQVDETVTLDASESTDPDGSITEYQWKIYRTEDGRITPEPIATPTGRTVEFSFAEPNTYRIELTVRDDHDATATTSELVDVNAPPRPAFDIRPPHPNPGDAVTFDASASTDPDGEPIRHKWEFFEKPAQNRIATIIGETVTRTFSGGTYAVRLTVTDDEGASATTTSTLEVGNLPPTADFDANPPGPAFNEGVVFDGGRSSDPDGSIASYDWEILKRTVDGSKSTTVETGTGKLLSYRFEDTGPHTVRLTVTDDDGATDTKSIDYDIARGEMPTAKIQTPDEPIPAGEPVTFSGAPSESPAGEIVEYNWRVGPEPGEWTAFGAQETFTHTFPESGRYAVQLTVYNDENVSATQEIGVMVGDAPVAQFEVMPDTTPAPNEEVTFDASASRDPDGSITNYQWKFFRKPSGNPETATGRTVTRSFDVGTYAVMLKVTDDKGLSDESTKTINVSTPPVARFDTAPDSPEPGEEVTLDASRSNDPDGSITSYEWTFQEQPFQNRETATGERVTRTFPEGSHAVTLTVTDDDGVTDTVSKTLNVAPPPRSPVARFDVLPSTPSPGEEVTLDASASTDPDGSITEYRWRVYRMIGGIIDPDPVVTLNGQSVTHTFSDTATYTIELTVTDDSEKTDTTSTTVVTRAPPEATFAVRPSKPTPGEEVTFDASESSDPDGSITSYEWTFQEQPFQNPETASGVRVTRTFSKGEYAVTLTVTDDTGATNTVSRSVIVSAAPEPPVARLDVSPTPPTQDEEVTFDASASRDPDGTIAEYQWQVFHTGGEVLEPDPIATLSGRSVTYTFPDPSTYIVELKVTDSSGKTDTASTIISVNTAPSSAFVMRPPQAEPGEEVTFDASESSDPDGSITSYEWTFQEQPFQNRETASGVRVTRTFSEGEYSVTLTVTDDDGATDTKSETLSVESVNQPPTASIDGPIGTVYTGVTVEFDGSGSEDPDGTITSYEWAIDPPTGEPVTRSGATVSYSVTDQGIHRVELTVSDDEGATDTTRMSFTVEETPLRPL